MINNIIITNIPLNTSRGSVTRTVSAIYDDNGCVSLNIHNTSSIIGNIYLGRVDNIVKNINSAFVSIDKNNTCYYSLTDNKKHYFFNPKNNTAVNQGDSILVQVKKDATKLKPASLSDKIELPGHYVVISLDVKGVVVSKKIKDTDTIIELRHSLQDLLDSQSECEDFCNYGINPGIIVRSNAASLTDIEPAVKEAKDLIQSLSLLIHNAIYQKAPVCLYEALPEYINIINDMPLSELGQVITDDSEIFGQISQRCSYISDNPDSCIRLYSDEMLPLYNLYDVRKEIEKALSRKIWLKSGGYIIIDYTEAMTVINVNSGKYVTKKHDAQAKENAFYLVNSQAATEIARQLRLRNISGMVIVDFINMENPEHIQGILKILKDEFKKDSVTTSVVDITKLGLVEITRKRAGAMLKECLNGEAAGNEL